MPFYPHRAMSRPTMTKPKDSFTIILHPSERGRMLLLSKEVGLTPAKWARQVLLLHVGPPKPPFTARPPKCRHGCALLEPFLAVTAPSSAPGKGAVGPYTGLSWPRGDRTMYEIIKDGERRTTFVPPGGG